MSLNRGQEALPARKFWKYLIKLNRLQNLIRNVAQWCKNCDLFTTFFSTVMGQYLYEKYAPLNHILRANVLALALHCLSHHPNCVFSILDYIQLSTVGKSGCIHHIIVLWILLIICTHLHRRPTAYCIWDGGSFILMGSECTIKVLLVLALVSSTYR